MANSATVILTTDSSEGNLRDRLINTNPSLALSNFKNYLSALVSGSDGASLNIKLNDGNAIAASSTLTCVSAVANDTALVNGVTLTAKDYREKSQVTCVADVAGSLNSKYFTFSGLNSLGVATNFYMWYNVNSAGVDPAVVGATGVMVALATGAVANTVASASRAKFALSPLVSYFTESGATDKILFQDIYAGSVTNTADGTAPTGFTFSTVINGAPLGADEWQIGTNTEAATNLAAAINLDASLAAFVTATSSTNVATVSANSKGTLGNTITLSATGGVAAGAARLSGGTADSSSTTYNYQR